MVGTQPEPVDSFILKNHLGSLNVLVTKPKTKKSIHKWFQLIHIVEVERQTHRINCPEHGIYVAEVPWAYPGNGFTKDFDLQVAWFASYLPRSTTSSLVNMEMYNTSRFHLCVYQATPEPFCHDEL